MESNHEVTVDLGNGMKLLSRSEIKIDDRVLLPSRFQAALPVMLC